MTFNKYLFLSSTPWFSVHCHKKQWYCDARTRQLLCSFGANIWSNTAQETCAQQGVARNFSQQYCCGVSALIHFHKSYKTLFFMTTRKTIKHLALLLLTISLLLAFYMHQPIEIGLLHASASDWPSTCISLLLAFYMHQPSTGLLDA